MTQVGKVLVVAILFACLAFMGFSAVVAVGGPNWQVEALALDDYSFTPTVSPEGTTWEVKTKVGEETLQTGLDSLAQAVDVAIKDQLAKQKTQLEGLEPQVPALEARLQQAQALNDADRNSMKKREGQLASVLNDQYDEINDLSNEGIKKAEEANQIWGTTQRRRQDIYRLRAQLESIRTDAFHLQQQRQHLEDLVIRTRGVLDRLKRRETQLKNPSGKATSPKQYDEQNPPVPEKKKQTVSQK